MKKSLIVLTLIMLTLTGCAGKEPPQEALTEKPAEQQSDNTPVQAENGQASAEERKPEKNYDQPELAEKDAAPISENAKQTEQNSAPPAPSAKGQRQPTAPNEQKEQQTPATEPAAPIEPDTAEIPNATADDADAVADKLAELINEYRAVPAEPTSDLNRYAKYRSRQIVTNYAHDTADQRAAATALQYGEYIEQSLYGMDGEPYYQANVREAIGKAGYTGTADEIAKQFSDLIRNSASHWNYVGSADYRHIGIGITYSDGMWYCAVVVAE